MPELPEPLLEAWQAIERTAGVVGVGQFAWSEAVARWFLPLRLRARGPDHFALPRESSWILTASASYPTGEVALYPDAASGIEATFPHQLYNGSPRPGENWRTGKLCLDPGISVLDRSSANPREPRTAPERLAWHVQRALQWIEAARSNTLQLAGDPFELPDYPPGGQPRVGFFEDVAGLDRWKQVDATDGLVRLVAIGTQKATVSAEAFLDSSESRLFELPWGPAVRGAKQHSLGLWMRLERLPVLAPWQPPVTWGELRAFLAENDRDLDAILAKVAPRFRDGRVHLLLLGAPIPDEVGGDPARLHWLALPIPKLSRSGDRGVSRGRPAELARRDRNTVMSSGVGLNWLDTENWADSDRTRRGRFGPTLRRAGSLLLGAGAVGSLSAECLARSGVCRFAVVDGETLTAGNLVRHVLDLEDLDRSKAIALAQRLERISPTVTAQGFAARFPELPNDAAAFAREADLIIDCTADDDVIRSLPQGPWPASALVASISIGALAERLYLYLASAAGFSPDAFFAALTPWTAQDRERLDKVGEIREGVGCWHAVFPARYDHLVLLCGSAVGLIEHALEAGVRVPQLFVLDRTVGEFGASSVAVRSPSPA